MSNQESQNQQEITDRVNQSNQKATLCSNLSLQKEHTAYNPYGRQKLRTFIQVSRDSSYDPNKRQKNNCTSSENNNQQQNQIQEPPSRNCSLNPPLLEERINQLGPIDKTKNDQITDNSNMTQLRNMNNNSLIKKVEMQPVKANKEPIQQVAKLIPTNSPKMPLNDNNNDSQDSLKLKEQLESSEQSNSNQRYKISSIAQEIDDQFNNVSNVFSNEAQIPTKNTAFNVTSDEIAFQKIMDENLAKQVQQDDEQSDDNLGEEPQKAEKTTIKKENFPYDQLTQRSTRSKANPNIQKVNYLQKVEQFSKQEYQLTTCSRYKTVSEQPFQLLVSLKALMMMDLHAHCSRNEVIGLLAGKYIQKKNINYLIIEQTYPCDSVTSQKKRNHNVEMCPESAVHAHSLISLQNQMLVGWYHSHPTFSVDPSQIDIENHCTHQTAFTADQNGAPFIAAIVGPYSRQCNAKTQLNCFHTRPSTGMPFNLSWNLMGTNVLPKSLIQDFKEQLQRQALNQTDKMDLQKEKWTREYSKLYKLLKTTRLNLEKIQGQFRLKNPHVLIQDLT